MSGENVRNSQSSRCQETGLKQKISPDVLYFQLYFHKTNDIPWITNKKSPILTRSHPISSCPNFSMSRKRDWISLSYPELNKERLHSLSRASSNPKKNKKWFESFYPFLPAQLQLWRKRDLRKKMMKVVEILGKVRNKERKMLKGQESLFDLGKHSRFEIPWVFCFDQVLNDQGTR